MRIYKKISETVKIVRMFSPVWVYEHLSLFCRWYEDGL